MIILRDQPLANDHLEWPASCKWSSGVAGLLQMIIRTGRPLANDHLSPLSPLSPLPGSRFNLADLSWTICSLLWRGIQMVVMQASIQRIRYFSVTIPCVTRRSMHGKGRWSSRLRRRRAPSRGCTPGWTWAKSVILSTWLIVITSGISPGASSFGLSFGPLWEEKRAKLISNVFQTISPF